MYDELEVKKRTEEDIAVLKDKDKGTYIQTDNILQIISSVTCCYHLSGSNLTDRNESCTESNDRVDICQSIS